VIAVTVLTSLGESALADIGVPGTIGDQVIRLATLAQTAALDGVVASPREIALIRAQCGERFTIVTPGIRGSADLKGDQTRTESAQAALEAGATYIVVGRPIIAAPDPRAAAEAIANECRGTNRPVLGG
jgi:orotidine-5'-phosphate decarboxylase